MTDFIRGAERSQSTLFPERLDDYIAEGSAVHVIDAFIDELDLSGLGFGTEPQATGRPAYHPKTLLKIYVYGYLNRVQSSRRLERECQRNVELMWLTSRLVPDFKTIADFCKDNGTAIRLVCREFVMLCRKLDRFAEALVAIDGSKFKAVNNRDRNFTKAKMKRRLQQVDRSIERYLGQLASADRHPFGTLKAWMGHTHFLMKRLENVRTEMSLHVLAYNLRRVINILRCTALIAAIRA
jgi:transposase